MASMAGIRRQKMAQMKASQEAAVKQERTTAKAAKTAGPSSLVSNETMSREEPITSAGMDWSGKMEQPPVPSLTSGHHHGRVSAIADAVGYSLAAHAEGKEKHSKIGKAYGHLDTAYAHLAMHHTYNLQGQHDKAASSLGKAADSIKAASGTISAKLDKTGVTNAFGETRRRRDLDATLDHTVMNYATKHGVSTKGTLPKPKDHDLDDFGQGPSVGAREGSTNLNKGRLIDMGRTQTHVLGGQQLEAYRSKVAERGGDADRSPGLERMETMKPVMTRKDHVLQAHSDLMNKGKIHKNQLAALTSNEIDDLHELTGVPRPRDTRSSSLPSTPMPRERGE